MKSNAFLVFLRKALDINESLSIVTQQAAVLQCFRTELVGIEKTEGCNDVYSSVIVLFCWKIDEILFC